MSTPAESSHVVPNVFLSWSGQPSKDVAVALKTWLPEVLEDKIQLWFSDQDIEPSDVWMEETLKALAQVKSGLFVITPSNVDAPWIHFEAGAIAGSQGQTRRVYVLLLGLTKGSLPASHPLERYQAVQVDREGLSRLVKALNVHAGLGIKARTLDALFKASWRTIKPALEKAASEIQQETAKAAVLHAPPAPVVWSALSPRLQVVSEQQRDDLRKQLQDIRALAIKILSNELKQAKIRKAHVRACVFLPDLAKVTSGILELYIPSFLRDWADPTDNRDRERHEKETEVRFWLNQGVVGRVFVNQQHAVALASSPTAPRWSPSFRLSPAQEDCVHPNLEWILAFPLKRRRGVDNPELEDIMGVLAVDGLGIILSQDELEQLTAGLFVPVTAFAAELAKVAMARVRYHVDEGV